MSEKQLSPWQEEVDELAQSLTRALIFGIALIYTMEAWWIGEYLDIWKLLLFFFLALLVNLYLIPIASGNGGLTIGQIVRKAIRNKGVAVLVSFILLALLGRITPFGFPYERDVATVILLSIPISVGADVAQIYQLYQGSGKQKQQKTDERNQDRKPWKFILNDIASSSGGALFVALPLAPTAEIPLLTSRLDFWQELMVILLSVFIAHMIVYGTGVNRTPPSGKNTLGARVWPYADALLSYTVALLVSAAILFLFGRIDVGLPPARIHGLVITMGLPAVIGAAAGKLVL